MDLNGKQVVVVGLGRSGKAAAALCLARGARVIGVDSRAGDEVRAGMQGLDVELRLGTVDAPEVRTADLVVVSPGVPPLSMLDGAARAGIEVIGELELGFRFFKAPIIAVGGTNGKSTTTTLIAEMLQAAGRRVFAGGNLGAPLCEAVGGNSESSDAEVGVIEVSSFQLERVREFRPRVSVLLNVTDDHLDRYVDFAAYARAKGNAFTRQEPEDVAIIPVSDALCEEQARRGKGRIVTFGVTRDGMSAPADYAVDYTAGERARVTESASKHWVDLTTSPLVGRHNFDNAAAAIAAVRALDGCSLDGRASTAEWSAIERGIAQFTPLPHRMARVAVIDGVSYYDDSKATNVGAAVTALRGLLEPRAVLIAGGRDKQGSYEPLVQALRERGRALVVLGEAAETIAAAAAGALSIERAETMEQAVKKAAALAQPKDAVLLSPACSSFDLFKSYADRGEHFVRAVLELQTRHYSP